MSIFGFGKDDDLGNRKGIVLPDDQRDDLEADISLLGDQGGVHEQRIQRVAEREVQSAAEDSVKKIHIISMGRCPECGEHLLHHLTANICENCGWHKYATPRSGAVKVHMRDAEHSVVEGDHAYVLKEGDCLVVRGEVVFARIPAGAYSWVEYVWKDEELEQRQKQYDASLQIVCAWCGGEADVNKDGFHMIHVAFGMTQERYCFCCDECFEAFRKMYPSRVHRNCYDTNCNDCNLCIKRYGDEAEGIRVLAKDRLAMKK